MSVLEYQPVGTIADQTLRENFTHVSASILSISSEIDRILASLNSALSVSGKVVITNPGFTDRNLIQPLGVGVHGVVLKAPVGSPTGYALEGRNSSGTVLSRLTWDGTLALGTATAPPTQLFVVGGTNANMGLRLQDNETNSTLKQARIKAGHYTNSEEPFTMAIGVASSSTNTLYLGGSASDENAATAIDFYTAATTSTLTGTRRGGFDTSGNFDLSGLTANYPRASRISSGGRVQAVSNIVYASEIASFANFQTFLTNVGAAEVHFIVDVDIPITSSVSIPSTILVDPIPGGGFTISSSQTLTIGKMAKTAPFQIFSGSGAVAFSVGAVEYVLPEWWGAIGDDSTDCRAAIAAMSTTASTTILQIFSSKSAYRVASTLSIDGRILFPNGGKLKPANTIAITLGSSTFVKCNGDWKDTTLGGTFTNGAGSYEERLITRTSSPTDGRSLHMGFPGNTIHETSGVCFVFGGVNNQEHSIGSNSELSVIGGGYDNAIGNTSSASTIAGGAHHIIGNDASHTFIGGGSYQESYADYAVLCGGTLNKTYSLFGAMLGGHENTLGDVAVLPINQRSSVLVGGYQNIVKGLRSALVGGTANQATGDKSFLGGGNNNIASGENSVIPGGASNAASAQNSVVLGGASNISSSLATISGGESATASGQYAIALGEFLDATGSASLATGARSKAVLRGQRSHAAGYFAAKGDSQISEIVARVLTVASQTNALDLNGGSSTPVLIPDNTSWHFKVRVAARNIETDGENGAWSFEGGIKKDGTVGSTALIGSVLKTTINEPAGWSCLVDADTTNGALRVRGSTTGVVVDDIRWVARIELSEAAG